MAATGVSGTVRIDDLTIAYRERGDGPPIVLLHGWPTSSHLWREVMVPMAAANRVVAPDLPGFGASDKPLDRRYDFTLFETVLDGLTAQLGITELGLVVHDISGPVGVHWAIHNPSRVTKLAILNTLLYPPDLTGAAGDMIKTLSDPTAHQTLTGPAGLEAVMRSGLADPSRLTPELLAAVLEPFPTDDAQRALAAAGTQLDLAPLIEISERISELTMPVSVIYGTQDTALPVAPEFTRLQDDLPHAKITALDHCGHFLQEDAPEHVGQLLADFFSPTDSAV